MDGYGSLSFHFANTMSQVKSTMLVTVWVFIGIEGAVVFSGRAKIKKMLELPLLSDLFQYCSFTSCDCISTRYCNSKSYF